MSADTRTLTDSETAWADTRTYLREHRNELDAAAALGYPRAHQVAQTTLLSRAQWLPAEPLPLEKITVEWDTSQDVPGATLPVSSVLPTRADGTRYSSYADAVAAIAAPTVFENRPTYRLTAADLTGDTPVLRFGLGQYFDSINVGEAAAHAFAAQHRGDTVAAGVRAAVSDPCDPSQRPVNLAVSTLTIRRDLASGEKAFVLHWRDPRKVGHAGGMYQVAPVGIFQPSGLAEWNIGNDFSLWRNMIREFAEELGGADEDHGSERTPIDYDTWPIATDLTRGRHYGTVETYCLGMGVDPLTFATDLLTAVIIDAPVFDALFGDLAADNAEGRLLELQPFTSEKVDRLLAEHPMQAAGAAVLRLAISALG